MSRIEIANPVARGRKFTSRTRAERFVRRGDAAFDSSGKLVFTRLTNPEGFKRPHDERMFWNGDDTDPFAMHLPGTVRS